MTIWRDVYANGSMMGSYSGDTEVEVLDAYARDAGYADFAALLGSVPGSSRDEIELRARLPYTVRAWLTGDFDAWSAGDALPGAASTGDVVRAGVGWVEVFDVEAASPSDARERFLAALAGQTDAETAHPDPRVAVEVDGEDVDAALDAARRRARRYGRGLESA